jgi:hypothetical protein
MTSRLAVLQCTRHVPSERPADVALEMSLNFEAGDTMAVLSPAGLVCLIWQVVTYCGSAMDYVA